MIEDRNKTDLTKLVTQDALNYLDERGCKPIETEVSICEGWTADLAGVLNPTITELGLLKLIKSRPKYGKPGYEVWYQNACAIQNLMTVIVEVKTSRSDFCGDKKWKLSKPANLAYLAIPNDLKVSLDEFPAGWGILAYYEKASMRCVRVPEINSVSIEQQLSVILEIAVRRDNNTRYERLRQLRREISKNANGEVSRTRMLTAFRAMQSIVEGKHGSIEGALEYHGVRKIPDFYIEEIKRLWAVGVPKTESGAYKLAGEQEIGFVD